MLSYIGLAASIGYPVTIPFLTQSLTQYLHTSYNDHNLNINHVSLLTMDAQMGNTKDISASFLVSWWEQAVITNEVQILGQSVPSCMSQQYFGTMSYPQSGILSQSATAVNFQLA